MLIPGSLDLLQNRKPLSDVLFKKLPDLLFHGPVVPPGQRLVSAEESAQVDRLRYLLSHGVKEGLVAHACDWPGVHSVREILAGEPIRGLWFNRTQESAARKRGEDFDRLKYATEETFELTPLPCWAHLTPEDYRQSVAELVDAIESEANAELARTGRVPLGVAAILRQTPETRPSWRKKSPAPMYHAATRAMRKAFWEAYATFVAAFRKAADRWREGDRSARVCPIPESGWHRSLRSHGP